MKFTTLKFSTARQVLIYFPRHGGVFAWCTLGKCSFVLNVVFPSLYFIFPSISGISAKTPHPALLKVQVKDGVLVAKWNNKMNDDNPGRSDFL